ncbi:SpoIIE family protein phosphatase [Desulfovibrio sp. JC022]|uniref:SpoIIE family protein phosphatase n=1 Tax=Desulfovibrio sp. JC022 TaxID=2593642 RepID=UPI0013D6B8CC|nr:SpoIIE family protein phosphatase [Desulfovibrio sp. JC022]
MNSVDCHLIKKSLLIHEDECGDAGYVRQENRSCFFALIDGLGHGRPANIASNAARHYLESNDALELTEMMQGMHEALVGTRGAVAALCRLNLNTGRMDYIGVGNICTRVFGGIENFRFVPSDGVVGYHLPTLREKSVSLSPGDVVMLYSDGIKESFEEFECPGLLVGSAEDIAGRVFSNFYKGDDDGSCLVVRYG